MNKLFIIIGLFLVCPTAGAQNRDTPSITLVNTGVPGVYEIVLDGKSASEKDLAGLTPGSHRITVQQTRMTGTKELVNRTLELQPGDHPELRFAVPYILPEEWQSLEKARVRVRDLWWNPEALVETEKALTAWESLLKFEAAAGGWAVFRHSFEEYNRLWPAQRKVLEAELQEAHKPVPSVEPKKEPAPEKTATPAKGPQPFAFAAGFFTAYLTDKSTYSETHDAGVELFLPLFDWNWFIRPAFLHCTSKAVGSSRSSVESNAVRLGIGGNFPLNEMIQIHVGGGPDFGSAQFTDSSSGASSGSFSGCIGGEFLSLGAAVRFFDHLALNLDAGYGGGAYAWPPAPLVRLSAGWAF